MADGCNMPRQGVSVPVSMTSRANKQQRELQEQRKKRLDRFVWGPVSFVAGIIFTILFTHWLIPLLPGPRPYVAVQEMANEIPGCKVFAVGLITDEPVDSAYVRIAFPNKIGATKIGAPEEKVEGISRRIWEQTFTVSGVAGSGCNNLNIEAKVNIVEGISSTVTNNVLTIRTSELASHSPLMGMVVVDGAAPVMGSFVYDGEYSYDKWGERVRRQLEVKLFKAQ